jgi:hypothetical protein
MSQILPEGEAIRKAVKWIDERRQEEGPGPLYKLLEEASLKFNLSPSDSEFLQRFFKVQVDEG